MQENDKSHAGREPRPAKERHKLKAQSVDAGLSGLAQRKYLSAAAGMNCAIGYR